MSVKGESSLLKRYLAADRKNEGCKVIGIYGTIYRIGAEGL